MRAQAIPAKAVPTIAPAHVGVDLAHQRDCEALVTVHITHNTVKITAALEMGGTRLEERTWTRHRGPGKGWLCDKNPSEFINAERRLGVELAEFVDGIDFPFRVANMLPGRRSANTATAMEEAAKVLAND